MDRENDSFRFLPFLLKLGTAVVLLAAGAGLAVYFVATKPVVQKQKPRPQTVYVQAMKAQKKPALATVSGMGKVVPSQQVVLRARVTGAIVDLSERFLPGGRIPEGDVILRIDPSDYRIEVATSESELRKAMADLELEQGRQSVARQELALLREASPDGVNGTELALRKPQLRQAEAQVAIAESQLERAKLNLSRTVLRAPFNALVVDRQVDIGAQVGIQEPLATLAATDEYWIEVSVPADRLGLMDPGVDGNTAQIHSQSGAGQWAGRVLHSLGVLDENSRLAKVLVSVRNPLDSGTMPLMLGDYVQVTIQGRNLGEVYVLPRGALRGGDAVWIATEGRLDIRPVEVALRSGETVYVSSGLQPGELVITSDIAAPVPGMPLDVSGQEPSGAKGTSTGDGADLPGALGQDG
ncbi:MAG: efflux RND transporter periplasmic adaptor subunit [Desulfovibrionales bacterium]